MNRISQSLAALGGVLVLVAVFAGIANHLAREARLQAEAERLAALAPAPEAAPSPEASQTAAPAGRNVSPEEGVQRTPEAGGALVRLPPRLPETAPQKPEETDREVRLRLLSRPVAVDVGTIRVGRGTVTLPDIAPPSLDRTCTSAGGEAWPCGRQALTSLRAFLRGRAIRCEAPDGFGTAEEDLTSACTVGAGEDIGDWLVRNGWAEAAPDGPYAEAEAKAREARTGMWR
ncbi:thermonuclease family protein [Antarcticirhabdus aurantiaca]|uniref:Uncharacterized protein n=1 Tax=Antarcticirhabdus aurantiaca TaxID=2606717 RepID=A0ACD4NJD8_9HYPH|nr:hypothetical protein [Antarcticirhabdus aurantiaca]WAJ26806.1 hypothetical protein OXU80_18310 [Jeongeuplla avenae]